MRVSVLIPCYNYGRYLPEALESVRAQTFTDYEIIVADDGSEDETRSICEGCEDVRYLPLPHGGVSAARNAAIQAAKGEFIAFLDADDQWRPEKLQLQVEYMDAHPEVSLLYCRYENYTDLPEQDMSSQREELLGRVINDSMVTALIRRELFERYGLFDTALPFAEDTEWLYRVRLTRPECIAHLDQVLYRRRVHTDNLTLSHEDFHFDQVKPIIAQAVRNLKRNRKL